MEGPLLFSAPLPLRPFPALFFILLCCCCTTASQLWLLLLLIELSLLLIQLSLLLLLLLLLLCLPLQLLPRPVLPTTANSTATSTVSHVYMYNTTYYLKLSAHLNNSHCLLMFLLIALCCQCHLKQPAASLWWDCRSRWLFSWLWVFIPLGWVTCLPLCTWLGSTKSYYQKSAESILLTNSNNSIL